MAQRDDETRVIDGPISTAGVGIDVGRDGASAPDGVHPGPDRRPAAASSDAGLTPQRMHADVARDLARSVADIAPDDDLVAHGLDSMRIMQLVGEWRRRGVRLRFADLVERPTLEHWWKVLAIAESDAAAGTTGTDAAGDDDAPQPAEDQPFPLTPMQYAYWIGRRDDQVLGGVGCHFYVEFDGDEDTPVDPDRLDAAVRALLRRHDLLRARFLDDGTQQILPESPWPGLTVDDLRDAAAADVERHLAERRETLAHRVLDVAHGEVFDVRLTLLPGGRHRMHVNFDLLVADVLSIQIVLEDLSRLYAEGDDARLPELGYGFPTYLARQERRRRQAREQAREYWRSRIPTMPAAPQLPLATAPEQVKAHRFRRRDHLLDVAARHRLEEVCRRHAVTPSVVLAAAYAEVLGAWSATPRFLVSLPLFDREITDPHVGRLVADFTNLVPLEVDVSDSVPFVERVRRLQSRLRTDVGHSEYAGVEVLRDLTRSRPDDRHPATVVFTSAIGMGDLVGQEVQQVFGRLGWMLSQTPQVWLDHQVVERDGGLLLVWDAVEELFAPGVLDAMFGAYVGLLEWLVEGEWGGVVPALLPAEQRVVRAGVNATAGPVSGRLLHEGFFVRAVEEPGRSAVFWDGGELSYGDLADRALRVAAWLTDQGVRPGEAVAVHLPKGPDQIAAVLGVLAAGAAYVPVGVDQPPARRDRIYRAAEVRVVLDDLSVAEAHEPLPAPRAVDPGDRAYVIFTSGSTGEPKGVVVSHSAAVNTVEEVCSRFGVGVGDRVLAVSALDFDLSVFDVFGLLGVGGGVVLV
ncbi:AMP-binding protein, partial [Micromonospora okii]|uniref:AMP-binding protein n=1 Tax=Micromonospora okii TaxID=1182970 RepID=UPI002107FF34